MGIYYFINKDGSKQEIKNVHEDKNSIPPFYLSAFDGIEGMNYVGVRRVSPADLLKFGEVFSEAPHEQMRSRTDASEELTAKINSEGFDGARLIVVEEIDGKYVILGGYGRRDYCLPRYSSILVYVFKQDVYDVNDTIDVIDSLNGVNDVAERITIEDIIRAAETKIKLNGGGNLVPGEDNSEETINRWFVRCKFDKQFKGLDGGPGGLSTARTHIMRIFGNQRPEEVGLTPMKGKDQRNYAVLLQSKADEIALASDEKGVKWISLDVSSGSTTNAANTAKNVLDALTEYDEVRIVIGTNTQQHVHEALWNRFIVPKAVFKNLNLTASSVLSIFGHDDVVSDAHWEDKVTLWTFANLKSERDDKNATNPYGFSWHVTKRSLAWLEKEAAKNQNKAKYNRWVIKAA